MAIYTPSTRPGISHIQDNISTSGLNKLLRRIIEVKTSSNDVADRFGILEVVVGRKAVLRSHRVSVTLLKE